MTTELLPQAVKKSPKSNHKFATYLIKLGQSMTGNVNYATPNPTGAALTAAGEGLAAANAAAKNGGTVATAARDAKRRDAEGLVDQLVTYVQVNVNANAGDPATANAIIVSSGLSVHKRTRPNKAQLAAYYGAVSSEVLLVALAVAHSAAYMWDFSLDGKNWTSVPQTMKARTTISGLTPGQIYYFRFHAQTRKAIGPYSQVVSLMVH
jgi:hypothetical protein